MVALKWLYPPRPKSEAEIWEWPGAIYDGALCKPAAYILCETQYSDIIAKTCNHKPLQVLIFDYSHPTPHRKLSNNKFFTLAEAIQFVSYCLDTNLEWQPKIV